MRAEEGDDPARALPARLAAVRAEIAAAARRVGRDPAAVRVIAVTKTLAPAVVSAAVAAGLADVGENYVQEAGAKRRYVPEPATWHLIGGLQRNKVRAAVAVFDCVHTVDSVALADSAKVWARQAPHATLQQVADHIEHIRDVAGIDHVGLGSDFDGITSVPIHLSRAFQARELQSRINPATQPMPSAKPPSSRRKIAAHSRVPLRSATGGGGSSAATISSGSPSRSSTFSASAFVASGASASVR